MSASTTPRQSPLIQPLGDHGLIVRFAETLSDAANRAAIGFASGARGANLPGVTEVASNLVSVLLKYDPAQVAYETLAGEVRLLVGGVGTDTAETPPQRTVRVRFDGDDVGTVAAALNLSPDAFIASHCARPLRVLATGFAPGFVYCGFHPEELAVPRRTEVRGAVPAGTVIFAARQTAITSTPIPTGWHVIGHTDFSNFDPAQEPPTTLREGEELTFEAIT
jgi:KipI family sensor histidine kinase inhibitor